MKTYQQKARLSAPATKALEILATPEHLEDEAKVEGAVSAKARIESRDDRSVTIVVDRQDPGRTPTGRDPKKTEKTVLTVQWDLQTMKNTWHVRVIGNEKMAKIFGNSRLEPDGESACFLHEEGNIDIRLPLVGNLIAGVVANDIKRDFPTKVKLLEKKLNARS